MSRPRVAGFTLIELLIALALLALIAALLTGSLSMAARSWDGGETKAGDVASMRQAQTFLREQLTAMTGVEVHAVTSEGHMVVTIERPTDGEMTGAFDAIHQLPGVLSAALVYHHDEPVDE